MTCVGVSFRGAMAPSRRTPTVTEVGDSNASSFGCYTPEAGGLLMGAAAVGALLLVWGRR
jgi:hypothetical protein